MADEFRIEELTGTDPQSVVLTGKELPFGRPRRGGAFDLGGPVNHDTIYLDGRIEPIVHAKQAQFHPVHLKGHFRDRFTGDIGRAWAFVQSLERIRNNMRLLRLSWWQLTWTAFMADGKFPVEGTSDFEYEIRFTILSGPTTQPTGTDDDRLLNMTTSPADLAADARAMLAADRANMEAVFWTHVAASSIDRAYAGVDTALSAVEDSAAAFEGAPARADAQAKQLIAKAEEAKNRCDDVQALMDGFSAPAASSSASDPRGPTVEEQLGVLTSSSAESQATYWAWLRQAAVNLLMAKDSMRKMQYTARQRINAAKKLYTVAEGDTLETIALKNRLPASKATEMGYRQADLTVGRTIRIPAEE